MVLLYTVYCMYYAALTNPNATCQFVVDLRISRRWVCLGLYLVIVSFSFMKFYFGYVGGQTLPLFHYDYIF